MVMTKERVRVEERLGRTIYRAVVGYDSNLGDDPPEGAWLLGDCEYLTSNAAKRWVEKRLRNAPKVTWRHDDEPEFVPSFYGRIDVGRYEPDEFPDDEYGTVHDAMWIEDENRHAYAWVDSDARPITVGWDWYL